MINFIKKIKFNKACPTNFERNGACPAKLKERSGGFTYIELIVVLSIFAMMTSLVLFNYGAFQDKVDIKVLSSDIALKIVQAQKDATSGKWNNYALTEWKPSYGVVFKLSEPSDFIYFTDLANGFPDQYYEGWNNWPTDCPVSTDGNECLNKIHITKNNRIAKLQAFDSAGNPMYGAEISSSGLSINFTRPSSNAVFYAGDTELDDVFCAQIDVSTSGSSPTQSSIKVYSSGRIQLGKCVQQ